MSTTKKVASVPRVKRAVTAHIQSEPAKKAGGVKAKKTTQKTIVKSQKKQGIPVTAGSFQENANKNGSITVKTSAKTVKKTWQMKEKTQKKPFGSSIKQKLPSLQLALLSPYRLPINAERLAIGTARFGGVFFVIVGAIFSLFFANGSFSSTSQQALVSTANTSLNTDTSVSIDCTDPLHYLSTSCATLVDTTPDVVFQVDGADTISGIVRVRIKVAHADRVSLNTYYKTQSRELQIASMQKISDDTWEFYWNTTTFDDGDYKLKVLVGNGYGTYEVVDTRYIFVENHPLITTAVEPLATTTATTDSGVTSTTASSTPTSSINTGANANAVLSVQSNLSLSEFRFEVATENADKVKIYAYHVPTSKNILLGYAVKATTVTWKYKWLASSFAEGEYRIKAQVITNSLESSSNSITLILKKPLVTDVTATSTVTTADSPLDSQVLKPKANIQVQASSPIASVVGVKIDVDSATNVELYTQERYGIAKKYLGNATNVDENTWVYGFDTRKIPNGEYKIIASIKNQYGSYDSESTFIKVQNTLAITYTPKQEEQIKVLSDIGTELKINNSDLSTEKQVVTDVEPVDSTKSDEDKNEYISVQGEQGENSLTTFDTRIEEELQRLASAFRMNDQKAIVGAKIRLEKIKQEIIQQELGSESAQDIREQIDARLSDSIRRTEEDVKVTEKIITERTQKEASQDSDFDGVADYDEVAIYKTDPFISDSDRDGFGDGVEILNGYNPTDARAETLVAFESPKESGIVREDILEVQSVITATKNDDSTDAKPEAIISGKALPNSYVTLYIFSTPTIVTVKTEADGSWNYRFDKELEDGEHQVYIGVTDNAGKIVAKSAPFAFVKTAQAFSPVDANIQPESPVTAQEKSFLSEYMVYLVLSISVVAIGLVLILLGLHLDSRQRKVAVVTAEEQPAV